MKCYLHPTLSLPRILHGLLLCAHIIIKKTLDLRANMEEHLSMHGEYNKVNKTMTVLMKSYYKSSPNASVVSHI